MRKKYRKLVSILLSVIMLIGLFPMTAMAIQDNRTIISSVEGTSDDFESTAVFGGLTVKPSFETTAGSPAYLNSNMFYWNKYNEETKVWETINELTRFTAGKWRGEMQVRIDGDSGYTHRFEEGNLTVTINGKNWEINPEDYFTVSQSYSMAWIHSPEIIIIDDGSSVNSVAEIELSYSGLKTGSHVSDFDMTTSTNGVLIHNCFIIKDLNTDGDDSVIGETDVVVVNGGAFEAGVRYLVILSLIADNGYDFLDLTPENVNMKNAKKEFVMIDPTNYKVCNAGFVLGEEDPSDENVITSQPKDTAVKSGSKATFSVKATGSNLKYQWQYKSPSGSWTNSTSSSSKTATFTVTSKTSYDGYQYRCKVTSGSDTITSDVATLSVVGIKKSPADATASAGEKVNFTVEASGKNISYQWYYKSPKMTNWATTAFSGNKTATLTVTPKSTYDGYKYYCKVTDGVNTVYSSSATLTIKSGSVSITSQPKDAAVKSGNKATFSVKATGDGLKYQWYYKSPKMADWATTAFSGNKSATLTVTTKTSYDGYQYRCVVSDANGKVTSQAATLSVVGIKKSPADATASVGEKVNFTVDASGKNISYQWYYKSPKMANWATTAFSGNKTATLTVTPKSTYDGYKYYCKVTDGVNTANSYSATLTIVSDELSVTSDPSDVTAKVGSKATFNVEADGNNLEYQWQYRSPESPEWKNSTTSSGKTDTLTLTAKFAYDGYQYRCIVTDGKTVTNSLPATLTVIGIRTSPEDVSAAEGDKAYFSVDAQGDDISYQWQYRKNSSVSWSNSTVSSGKTSTLSVTAKSAYNNYQYRCVVKIDGTTFYSDYAALTIE